MKAHIKVKTHLAGIAGVCAALAAALALPAFAADTGLYFDASAGANWAQDLNVKVNGLSGSSTELDTGFRFSAGVGYNLDKNWGVEFDTGWVWNGIKHSGDSSISHIPFLVNAVYRFPIGAKMETYIGFGVGGAYSVLNIDDSGVNDDDGDVVFAYQGVAGFRYHISETMSVGVGYKFLGTTEGQYNIAGSKIKIEDVRNHTFAAVFNWKF